VIALPGGCLLPGFVDAHLHFRALVRRRRSLDCAPARSAAGLLARLAEVAPSSTGWLFAHGLEHRRPGFGGLPGLDALDRVTSGRPLWLRHRGGHLSLLNRAALRELAWFEADPAQGRVERYAGLPTGLVHGLETTISDWMRTRQRPAPELDVAETARDLLRLGITAFADLTPANRAADLPDWAQRHAAGTIPQRVSLWVAGESLTGRGKAPVADPVRLGGIKVLLEQGSTEAQSPEALARVFRRAARGGWPVAVHAVDAGDIAFTLEALRSARRHPPHVAPRLRIEHGHLIPPALVRELRGEAVALCVQPGMLWELGHVYAQSISREEAPWLLPTRSLEEAASALAIGSDAPAAPLNPLRHVAAAVTRRDAEGRVWNAAERIEVERALSAITRDAARLAGFGAELGALQPGMSADAVYFREDWRRLRESLLRGEVPRPAGTLIAGCWHDWTKGDARLGASATGSSRQMRRGHFDRARETEI
jgi:hypothetical protein